MREKINDFVLFQTKLPNHLTTHIWNAKHNYTTYYISTRIFNAQGLKSKLQLKTYLPSCKLVVMDAMLASPDPLVEAPPVATFEKDMVDCE